MKANITNVDKNSRRERGKKKTINNPKQFRKRATKSQTNTIQNVSGTCHVSAVYYYGHLWFSAVNVCSPGWENFIVWYMCLGYRVRRCVFMWAHKAQRKTPVPVGVGLNVTAWLELIILYALWDWAQKHSSASMWMWWLTAFVHSSTPFFIPSHI